MSDFVIVRVILNCRAKLTTSFMALKLLFFFFLLTSHKFWGIVTLLLLQCTAMTVIISASQEEMTSQLGFSADFIISLS